MPIDLIGYNKYRMIAQLKTILQHKCRLETTNSVILGVSGGADSVCLLDVFCRCGYPVIVAHFNHHLRPDAEADAGFVRRLAQNYAVPFVYGEADVIAHAIDSGLSVEAAGRECRYNFLFTEAEKSGSQAVVVAHQADDQVETLLLHLLRGTGLTGLVGMRYRALPNPWSHTLPLVRPLLDVWKADIWKYVQSGRLPSIEDQTNLETVYRRNRVRTELIPFLESFNPAVRKAIWRTASTLREDQEILEGVYADLWQAILQQQADGAVALDLDGLRIQPLGAQRALLRRAIACLRPGLADIGLDLVERGLLALENPPASGQCDIGAGFRLVLEQGRVWIARWDADLPGGSWPQIDPASQYLLAVPGTLNLGNGWELAAELEPNPIASDFEPPETIDPFRASLDADQVQAPLTVRARQSGDRFHPLGMQGHSLKLSDFMVNVKLPSRARAGWPLVFSTDELVWVPGFRQNHAARITKTTKTWLALTLRLVSKA